MSTVSNSENYSTAGGDRDSPYRWVILGLVVFVTAVGLMAWAAIFPLLNLWIQDLGVTRAQGGLLFSLYFIPGIFIALPAGWFFDRFPVRSIFIICWAFIVLGILVMSVAPSFFFLCVGRLLFALGMNVHHVGAPKLVAVWFEGRREFGLVMGIYTWSYTIGIFSSLIVLGKVGEDFGWRSAMYVLVVLVALAFVAVLMFLRPASHRSASGQESQPAFHPFELGWAIWLLAFIWLFYSTGIDSYKTFTPDYLVQRGYSLSQASLLVSIYVWVAFVMKPLFSYFLRSHNAAYFIAVGSALGMVGYPLLLQEVLHPLLIALLLGISVALVTPALYAFPAFVLGSRRAGQGYGLCQLFYSLGFFTQPLIGYTIDKTGSHNWAYTLMSTYAGVSLLCALLLRFSQHRLRRN